jgi:excinuclease ABC subunit A
VLYILDEPTTGLHFDDVSKLLMAFRKLIDGGGSLIVIEHNLDVIKSADWVIDMGPEGGWQGGQVVAVGTPEEIAGNGLSHTGRWLRGALQPRRLQMDGSAKQEGAA